MTETWDGIEFLVVAVSVAKVIVNHEYCTIIFLPLAHMESFKSMPSDRVDILVSYQA